MNTIQFIVVGALVLAFSSGCAIPKQPVGVSCQQFAKAQAKVVGGRGQTQSKAFQQSRLVCRVLYDTDAIKSETDEARLRTASGQLTKAPAPIHSH